MQGWKTRDNRLWNAKCLLMHKMQFPRTSQNTYCTLQSINQMQLKAIVAPKRTADRASTANMLQVMDTRFAKALMSASVSARLLNYLLTCLLIRPNHSFKHYPNVRERRLLCYVSLSIQIMYPCFPVPRFPPL